MLDSSGTALANASLSILDASGGMIANGLTNRLGKFSISQVRPGAYLVAVHLEHYVDRSTTILVQEHQVTEVDIALVVNPMDKLLVSGQQGQAPRFLDPRLRGDASLAFSVVDQNGAVIQGTTVSLEQISTGLKVEGKTDDRGVYRLPNLAAGTYSITFAQTGFRQEKLSLDLGATEDRRKTITL